MVELFNSILPSLFLLLKIDFSIKNTLSRFMDRVFFRGSIINVGVTPLRCHFQHYFFAQKISIQDSHTLQ